ncbi:MAG: phospholipase D-like domain-containing protein, partial [Turicibacter sp.]|nr:phospholipase D-like domain-containing protein [Turicibacter sp.]
IIDDEFCTIGSTNIDQRSFKINYEVNAFIYDCALTAQVSHQFQHDLENCIIVDESYEKEKSFFVRIEEGIYRLVSMIL